MKRCLMLFMTTALLIFSLAACGCSAQQAGSTNDSQNGGSSQNDSGSQNDSAVMDSDNGSQNGGSGSSQNGGSNGGSNASGGAGGGAGSDAGSGAGQDANNPMIDSDGNVIDETIDDITGGVSYEQMLRNGRVHDRDGNLNDHENASVNDGR